ncbi:hypothetical protein HELRODRAFT_184784, partial [Helobdella robusta]|uniref:Uncharacterized protein n=1 Tax=Helobdella robusta TaxID=6412 RepID=T1FLZ7_HELRO
NILHHIYIEGPQTEEIFKRKGDSNAIGSLIEMLNDWRGFDVAKQSIHDLAGVLLVRILFIPLLIEVDMGPFLLTQPNPSLNSTHPNPTRLKMQLFNPTQPNPRPICTSRNFTKQANFYK